MATENITANLDTEAEQDFDLAGEVMNSYELSFHILPNLTPEQVNETFSAIKELIVKYDGELLSEAESPELFNLAYEIIKHIEGRNLRFTEAHFGWIRFTIMASRVLELSEDLDTDTNILRSLVIKLTPEEIKNPFYFHEVVDEDKEGADNSDDSSVSAGEERGKLSSGEESKGEINSVGADD